MMRHLNESTGDAAAPAGDSWFADPDALEAVARTQLSRYAALGQIDGYEIRERIARGGQGVVFAAVGRSSQARVAVKILHEGQLGHKNARRRFEREIDVVADLNHPNIVSAISCGTTDAGLPYLVMPRIEGAALDHWAAQQREARRVDRIVNLIAVICETVHFAHQRGVIHRDLKPGNVLVDESDTPRVLDFGLAKIAFERGTPARSVVTMTEEGQFVGSLPWTSPEQLSGDARSVDVRTDTYAIGVMLYQALTGAFPYRVEGALPAVVHSVMNVTPRRPSEVNTNLSPDLDAIVLKALAKSPDARYQSAGEFACDLRSFCAGEPLLARRERSRETLRRTVRQYQSVTLVGAIMMMIVVWLYFQAAADRDRAETEAAKALASAEFLQDLLADVDPSRRGIDVTVAEMLDQAAVEIPMRFAKYPEVEATLQFMLGRAYTNIGAQDRSSLHLERAWRLRREVLGAAHLATLEAEFYFAGSTEHADETRSRMLQHVVRERRRQLGPDHRETLTAELYGVLWSLDGGSTNTLASLDDLVTRAVAILPPDDRLLHQLLTVRVDAEFCYGDLRRCVTECRSLLATFEQHPDPDYAPRAGAMRVLFDALLVMERVDESRPLLDHFLEMTTRVLGPQHPATVPSRLRRASWLVASGQLEAADDELSALAALKVDLSDPRPWVSYATALAQLRTAQGRHVEAISILEDHLTTLADTHAADHPRVRREECLLVFALAAAGRCDDVIALAEPLLAFFERAPLADHVQARLRLVYGECLLAVGEQDAAIPHLQAAHAAHSKLFDPRHSLGQRAADALGRP